MNGRINIQGSSQLASMVCIFGLLFRFWVTNDVSLAEALLVGAATERVSLLERLKSRSPAEEYITQ